jgi:hypothetical protein
VDNKIIALIIIVILVVIAGVYVFATQNSNNSTLNNTNNSSVTTPTQTITTNNSTTNNDTKNVTITAKQAQTIAIGAASELGGQNDTAGTPTLFKWTKNNLHTWAWNVPLFDAVTKKSDGSMDVDAVNGEVIMNE